MENITEMRKRHKQEITILQNLCSHNELSNWMEEYWAAGHTSGRLVKSCKFCGKIVETRGGKDWKLN